LIDDKDDQTGGVKGVDGNGTGCATATTSASASSATDQQRGVEVVAAFIVSSNCVVAYCTF
jgi:hypothetical protein